MKLERVSRWDREEKLYSHTRCLRERCILLYELRADCRARVERTLSHREFRAGAHLRAMSTRTHTGRGTRLEMSGGTQRNRKGRQRRTECGATFGALVHRVFARRTHARDPSARPASERAVHLCQRHGVQHLASTHTPLRESGF